MVPKQAFSGKKCNLMSQCLKRIIHLLRGEMISGEEGRAQTTPGISFPDKNIFIVSSVFSLNWLCKISDLPKFRWATGAREYNYTNLRREGNHLLLELM